jgi:transglutaminase-like putative cysteine protease
MTPLPEPHHTMRNTYDIDCELNYQVHSASTFVFKIEAAHTPDQTIVHEATTTIPLLPLSRHTDELGNRTLRINVPPGPFSVRYRAVVQLKELPDPRGLPENEVSDLPLDVLPYLTGSRYVESELLFNEAVNWIGTTDRGYLRVERICEWVRANVDYAIGTSLAYGTARDVLDRRTGVCRDYAHVAIALCRALNIPARFVVGHVMWDTPPPDFHALFEAYLGDRWVLFDPTAMAEVSHVIRIGTGPDASQLPFATIFGQAQMQRMNPLVFPAVSDRRIAA